MDNPSDAQGKDFSIKELAIRVIFYLQWYFYIVIHSITSNLDISIESNFSSNIRPFFNFR